MKKCESYLTNRDEKVHYKTTTYDEKGNVISMKNHYAEPPFEVISTYDENNNLVTEIEYQDGAEVSKFQYDYDEELRLISRKHFISDYLFSSVDTVFSEDGYTRTTFENEEEVERMVRKDLSEDEFQLDFFVAGEFKESQVRKWDEETRSFITTVKDELENVYQTNHEMLNADDKVFEHNAKSSNGDLISRTIHSFEGNTILSSIVDYRDGFPLTKVKRVYDDKERQIEFEKINDKGGVLESRKYEFDDQGRVVKEENRVVGGFDPEHGVPLNSYGVIHDFTD